GCFSVGPGLEERLGLRLDSRVARTVAEVEERVRGRVLRLRAELQDREAALEQERRKGERMGREKEEVEERVVHLTRQMHQVDLFLREMAAKEAEAKVKL
ncbi:hypothetical protein CRUP_029438, partial [Coryphaenoides rupestris]